MAPILSQLYETRPSDHATIRLTDHPTNRPPDYTHPVLRETYDR